MRVQIRWWLCKLIVICTRLFKGVMSPSRVGRLEWLNLRRPDTRRATILSIPGCIILWYYQEISAHINIIDVLCSFERTNTVPSMPVSTV